MNECSNYGPIVYHFGDKWRHHHHLFVHKKQHKMTMYNWRTGHTRLGKSS